MNFSTRGATADIGATIRRRRKQQNLTLQALGEVSGVSYSYISQVERGNATPTLGTLAYIAHALGVTVDYFISTPRPADSVTRHNERLRFSVDGGSITYERLGAEFPGNELSSFLLDIPDGYVSETTSHDGEEIIYVIEGRLAQIVDGERIDLRAGDSLHFRASRRHSYINDSGRNARLVWTGTLSLFQSPQRSGLAPDGADAK